MKTELLALASSDQHVYSCLEFREFQLLAKKIRGDPHENNWSNHATIRNCDHLCHSPYRGELEDPGCCDHNAQCSCALLSGTYTCVCGAGYFGLSGIAGHCRACPRGTYKSRLEPAESCKPCPQFSTTSRIASTSVNDCVCQTGYTGNNTIGIPCTPITCPPLQNPTNGIILGNCDNTFKRNCHFMCDDGFELVDVDSDVRTCRSDGTWSGTTTVCRRTLCSPLSAPAYGRKSCNSVKMVVGTSCRFRCNGGFIMQGSEVRKCTSSKLWSGDETLCLATECPVPPPLKFGTVYGCRSHMKAAFGEACGFRCNDGYKLIGPRFLVCSEQGKWLNDTGQQQRPYCIDNAKPHITCPENMALPTEKGKDYVYATWEVPIPSDNSGYEPKLITMPLNLRPPALFYIGLNQFRYMAMDREGLNTSCTVNITVLDNEAPRLLKCPNTIKESTADVQMIVDWVEPVFADNDRKTKIKIERTNSPGDVFTIGRHTVTYQATDRSGNRAFCDFDVIVGRTTCPYFAPPANGALSCEDWMYGQFCQVSCNDVHEFVTRPAEWYVCNSEAEWDTLPNDLPVPWPDCARPIIPSRIRKMLSGYYYSGDCNDPRVKNLIRKYFLINFINSFGKSDLCRAEGACTVDKVNVQCGRVDRTLFIPQRRRRRDVASGEELEVDLEFTIRVDQNFNDTDALLQEFVENMQNLDLYIERNLKSESTTPSPDYSSFENEVDDDVLKSLVLTNTETVLVCHPGSVLNEDVCVLCPSGTFYEVSSEQCVDCIIGYYQEAEGSLECKKCPQNTSTEEVRTKDIAHCKSICSPGTYSPTGLETCMACPIGTHQDEYGQSSCNKCLNGTTTAVVQADSEEECKEACKPGFYSHNGLEPCTACPKNYYQPHVGKTECLECPDLLSTDDEGAQDVKECFDFNPCHNLAFCANDGQCIKNGREFSCKCPSGFTGDHCESDIDECLETPCSHNGTCTNSQGSYLCVCESGFTGISCEDEVDECLSSPCLNDGKCLDKIDGYLCVCDRGFGGPTCEVKIELCSDDIVCLNGGRCGTDEEHNTPFCSCDAGYAGRDCSIDINDCENITCSNHGSCIDGIASFLCSCHEGYTGILCETDIDECDNNSCKSGSTCEDLIGNYQCLCQPGWSGIFCETKLDSDFLLIFPEEEATIANMASATISSSLSEVTVSMWIQTNDTERSGTPFSYAVSGSEGIVDNALTISDCSGVQIYVNNEQLITDVRIDDALWHHLAFTWSSKNGAWSLYKDGYPEAEGSCTNDIILGGGTLIIGQEQDTIGGGFSPLETFVGNITGVNVWRRCFNRSEIFRVFHEDDEVIGDVVAWPDFLLGVKGNIRVLKDHQSLTDDRRKFLNML